MQENKNVILYKMNIFLLQLLTIFIFFILALCILFFVCMICSYSRFYKKKSSLVKEVKETIEVKIDKQYEECSICLDKNEKKWIKSHCNHLYHHECLEKWIQINKSCPICREQL